MQNPQFLAPPPIVEQEQARFEMPQELLQSPEELSIQQEELLIAEMKKKIKQLQLITNKVKETSSQLKTYRTAEKKLKEDIKLFMSSSEIDKIDSTETNLKISYKKSQVKEPLSQKTIRQKLQSLLPPETIAEIFDNRQKLEKESISVRQNKPPPQSSSRLQI